MSQLAESWKISAQRTGDTFVRPAKGKHFIEISNNSKFMLYIYYIMTAIYVCVYAYVCVCISDWFLYFKKSLVTTDIQIQRKYSPFAIKNFENQCSSLKRKDEFWVYLIPFNEEWLPFFAVGVKNKRQLLFFWMAILNSDLGFYGFPGQIFRHNVL